MLRSMIVSSGMELQQVAEKIEVSPATMSNFVNNKNEINFYSALKIVRLLFPKQELEIMSQHCLEQNVPRNIRLAMEYTSFHNLLGPLKEIISREMSSQNAENREWARIYRLLYCRQTNKIKPQDFKEIIQKESVHAYEMSLLLRILEAYSYYDQKKYRTMFDVSDGLEQSVLEIKDDYIRESFYLRISQILANAYLRAYSDVERCRSYAHNVIDKAADPYYKAIASYTLGLSYLFEDYDRCMEYLNQAKYLFSKMGKEVKGIDGNIHFIDNVWGKNITEPIENDLIETAHREIRLGNSDAALMILDIVERTKTSPFITYYRGLALKDRELLYKSLYMFKQQGDLFYANLPKIELLKLGELPIILDTIFF